MTEAECQKMVDQSPELQQALAEFRQQEGFASTDAPYGRIGDGKILKLLLEYGPKIMALLIQYGPIIISFLEDVDQDQTPQPNP